MIAPLSENERYDIRKLYHVIRGIQSNDEGESLTKYADSLSTYIKAYRLRKLEDSSRCHVQFLNETVRDDEDSNSKLVKTKIIH